MISKLAAGGVDIGAAALAVVDVDAAGFEMTEKTLGGFRGGGGETGFGDGIIID